MGTKYSTQSASGYNSSPPSDDGSTVSTNQVKWATIKTKITDPVKTLADAINSQLVTALDVSNTTASTAYTTMASDHLKPIQVTGTTTISLGTAASMAAGYQVTVINAGTSTVTVALITGTDTLDGTAAGTTALSPGQSKTFATNSAASGYNTISYSTPSQMAGINDFRLTLTSVTPVTTSDVTGATTIYCTPYKGTKIGLYNGSAWAVYNSAEFNLALGTLTSGLPYDVFCYANAGVPTLELLAWSSGTARATALAYQDGILCKTGALTRRYLGTFYTTSTTATEDSLRRRLLFNYYNRVIRPMARQETNATWTYTTATVRQANAGATNQIEIMVGVSEDAVTAQLVQAVGSSGTTALFAGGLGLDVTNSVNLGEGACGPSPFNTNQVVNFSSKYVGLPGLGYHFIAWLESSTAVNTTTWYGSFTQAGATIKTGLSGTFMA